MKVKLYQINFDRDHEQRMFRSCPMKNGKPSVDSSIYDMVYAGEIEGNNAEDAFAVFNFDHPEDFRGHSMSVSDVLEIEEEKSFYYCDTIGFKKVEFDPEKTQTMSNTIRVVLCEPGKYARIADIDSSLEGLQKTVGGYIEATYPFDEETCLVCNGEGKISGLPLNRAIKVDGKIQDIIAGTFFICGCGGENFSSLSQAQQKEYLKQFRYPEVFMKLNGEIKAVSYKPDRTPER